MTSIQYASVIIDFFLNLIAGLRVRRRYVPGRGEQGRAAPVQRQGGRRSAHGENSPAYRVGHNT